MPSPTNPRQVNLPREIGGYEVQRLLGTGGMATVYAALQKQPRRTVAIKVMGGALNAEAAMHRFKREIEILGRLRHPYIAQVYAAGVHDTGSGSVPYFVMEYVPGARTIIAFAEAKELNLRERLKLFIKVCAAVEHGHRNKIIHRDLKPGNILIDETGEPKVIDFGVARAVEPDVTSQTMQTEEGRLIGTLQYMAPEQLEPTRQDLDARCDVYALGVLLYKLLTGQPPHDLVGLPVFTAAQVIREDVPPRPSSIRPDLKGDLETILLRALAKDRDRRYPSSGSLARDLLRYLSAKPIKARGASRIYRLRLFVRRHRSETTAAALVTIVVAAAAAVIVWQRATLDRGVPPGVGPNAVSQDGSGVPAPDGRVAATNPPVGPTDAATDEPVELPDAFRLGGVDDRATALIFDPGPDSFRLAEATAGLAVRWWDCETETTDRVTTDHDAEVRALAFNRDGSRLASFSADGAVVVVDRAGAGTRLVLRTRYAGAHAMALDPSGTTLAVACGDLTLRVIDADGTERHTLRETRGAFSAVAFSRDGRMLAGGSERGGVYVWNVADGPPSRRLPGLDERVVAIGFSAGDTHLAAVTTTGWIMIWALAGDRERGTSVVADMPRVDAVSFDATGRWLACASDTLVQIFELPSGARVDNVEPQTDTRITTIALYPGAYWIALGESSGGVRVEPVETRWTR